MDDPSATPSITESIFTEPNVASPCTETEDPTRTKRRTEHEEPSWMKSMVLSAEPRRATP